jgi:hypothetical protein
MSLPGGGVDVSTRRSREALRTRPQQRQEIRWQTLLTYLERYVMACGGRTLRLWTTPEDVEAQPFYEKRGYVIYQQAEEDGQQVIYRERRIIETPVGVG